MKMSISSRLDFTNEIGKINVRARLRVMATSKNDRINKTESEWRETLTQEQFCILRQHGTETMLRSIVALSIGTALRRMKNN